MMIKAITNKRLFKVENNCNIIYVFSRVYIVFPVFVTINNLCEYMYICRGR